MEEAPEAERSVAIYQRKRGIPPGFGRWISFRLTLETPRLAKKLRKGRYDGLEIGCPSLRSRVRPKRFGSLEDFGVPTEGAR
jgi:hypothetical protein